jgi:hypothetical protein
MYLPTRTNAQNKASQSKLKEISLSYYIQAYNMSASQLAVNLKHQLFDLHQTLIVFHLIDTRIGISNDICSSRGRYAAILGKT